MRSALLLLAAFVSLTPSFAADRPNILWLVSEDMNPVVGCYGDKLAHTPTIDQLAKDGVLYERCFTQPVCAPSRFSLITGTFTPTAGPAEHMRANARLPEWLKGFPTYLAAAGYYTTNNAKTDYNSSIDGSKTWNKSSKLAHWKDRPYPAQPFFAVFNHETTHESCLFPEKEGPLQREAVDPAAVRVPPYQPDTPEVRADWARFYNRIAQMDAQLAAKLAELQSAGVAEDTIVFYYGDNGGVLPRSKRSLQQSGSRVPLVIYFPPKWRHLAPAAPGTRISEPVCFADFAPTVLSLAGVPIPAHMQGRAFAGPAKATPREFVFCSRDRMDERYEMMRSAMDRRWLYIRNFRPDLPYVQHLEYMFKARGYQSWERLAAEGKLTPATAQFWGRKPSEELYDMEADPDNIHNLASDAAARPTLGRMREALRRHCLEIRDNGFVPEGSAAEGYENSRNEQLFPIERVYALAVLASERNPAHLPKFVEALKDPNEAIRWWAGQGCTILGPAAVSAEPALREALNDASGHVQVVAAEALGALGKTEIALPTLEKWLKDTTNPWVSLQAVNIIDRFGLSAKSSIAVIQECQAKLPKGDNPKGAFGYLGRMYQRILAVLEGREKPLVYPEFTHAAR